VPDLARLEEEVEKRKKGYGYFGPLERPDGGVSTEISMGVDWGEGEIEIPTLTPNQKPEHIEYLLNTPLDDQWAENLPQEIIDDAVAFAKQRIAAGKSPFAQEGEQPEVGKFAPMREDRRGPEEFADRIRWEEDVPPEKRFIPWEKISGSKRFQGLKPEEKIKVGRGWFDDHLAKSIKYQNLSEIEQQNVYFNFSKDVLGKTIPHPSQEAIHPTNIEFDLVWIATGAGAAIESAAVGTSLLRAGVKGGVQEAVRLGVMHKGADAFREMAMKLTDNQLVLAMAEGFGAGLTGAVGALWQMRVAAMPLLKAEKIQARAEEAYIEYNKVLDSPFEPEPGFETPPGETEPTWSDLMGKYGSPENLYRESGGRSGAARRYNAAREHLAAERAAGQTTNQAEAEFRANKTETKTNYEQERAEFNKRMQEMQENLRNAGAAQQNQFDVAIERARASAEARRVAGDPSAPADKFYAPTVVGESPAQVAEPFVFRNRQFVQEPVALPPPVAPPVVADPPEPWSGKERREFFGIRDKVDRGLMTVEDARAGKKPEVIVSESRLTANAADLAADYKAKDIERQATYSQFVKDRALKPEMNAKEFYAIYDSVAPKLYEPDKRTPDQIEAAKRKVIDEVDRAEKLEVQEKKLKKQFPDASPAQIKIMAQDPELKKEVAQGSIKLEELERIEKRRLQAQSETQVDMFPGTKPGQADMFEQPTQKEDVRGMLKDSGATYSEINNILAAEKDGKQWATNRIKEASQGKQYWGGKLQPVTDEVLAQNRRQYENEVEKPGGTLYERKEQLKKFIEEHGYDAKIPANYFVSDSRPGSVAFWEDELQARERDKLEYLQAAERQNERWKKHEKLAEVGRPTDILGGLEVDSELARFAAHHIADQLEMESSGLGKPAKAGKRRYASKIMRNYAETGKKLGPRGGGQWVWDVYGKDVADYAGKLEDEMESQGFTLEFGGFQTIYETAKRMAEDLKAIFTERHPSNQYVEPSILPIVDDIKSIFKRFYGLTPEARRAFTAIEQGKEGIREEVLDQIFNKGLPNLSKAQAEALLWHREQPTRFPIPEGLEREARFVDEMLDWLIAEAESRGLLGRWPESAIQRIEAEIADLQKDVELDFYKGPKAREGARQKILGLQQRIAKLSRMRYVPHLFGPSLDKQLTTFLHNYRGSKKLSSKFDRFIGRKHDTLDEFIAAIRGLREPILDIRVVLADHANYVIDKMVIYDKVEEIKNIPELVQPQEVAPSDWRKVPIAQLQNMRVHPIMAHALREFTGEYASRKVLLKAYDTVNRVGKFIVFYNPMIMTINDLSQMYVAGSLLSKEMGRTVRGFLKRDLDSAVFDATHKTELFKKIEKLGGFSSPYHGGPSMIDTAQMWVKHESETVPDWRKKIERSIGRELKKEDWTNPAVLGKDFYDMVFKATWFMDRIWRVTTVRHFMRQGDSIEKAVEKTLMFMVQYDYLPNFTRVNLNRIFLTPTYRMGMLRMYGNLARHPLRNKGAIGRLIALKTLIWITAASIGYRWMEGYRLVKSEKGGKESVMTLPGPMFEIEKLMGRAWTNTLYLNLARIPYLVASLLKNRDWKGETILNPQEAKTPAAKLEKAVDFVWYLTKTYVAPIERFDLLADDEQDALAKVMGMFAMAKYTRDSPRVWLAYKYALAAQNRSKAMRRLDKDDFSPENYRAKLDIINENYNLKITEIQQQFKARQIKLKDPMGSHPFWKHFVQEKGI